jgi:pSer/pThr/pTyr-binding forkhead associated (FHA) protein
LGSYNGCFVNGTRVVEQQPIHPNDLVQLGDYRLELHADEADAQAAAQVTPPRVENLSTTLNLSAQADRLVMVVGPTPGREFLLAQAPQRIGRGEECDICVNHSSVSRWHADINFIGSGRYEVVDHHSSNGIRINGVDLGRGLLDSRDLLELGDVVLKFIPAGQVYRPTPDESRTLAALLGVEVEGPPPSTVERAGFIWRSMSSATRWGAVLLGVVVVVLFAFVLANRNRAAESTIANASAVTSPLDPDREAIVRGTKLLEAGDFEQAHRALQSIPHASPLTADPAFQLIESKWGQNAIELAERSSSAEERRNLLELVSKTWSVNSTVRTKAAALLAQMQAQDPAVDVTSLPSGSAREVAVASPTSTPTVTPTSLPQDIPLDPHPSDAPDTSGHAGKQTTTSGHGSGSIAVDTQQRTATTAQRAATTGPAEPNLADLATSGNLDSVRTARDALKRKVAAGTATEREKRLLRASCRQLNDASCSR